MCVQSLRPILLCIHAARTPSSARIAHSLDGLWPRAFFPCPSSIPTARWSSETTKLAISGRVSGRICLLRKAGLELGR
ncbi:hypothetical protein AAMO2058_000111600 [Amorphochlora amoebiformis]